MAFGAEPPGPSPSLRFASPSSSRPPRRTPRPSTHLWHDQVRCGRVHRDGHGVSVSADAANRAGGRGMSAVTMTTRLATDAFPESANQLAAVTKAAEAVRSAASSSGRRSTNARRLDPRRSTFTPRRTARSPGPPRSPARPSPRHPRERLSSSRARRVSRNGHRRSSRRSLAACRPAGNPTVGVGRIATRSFGNGFAGERR